MNKFLTIILTIFAFSLSACATFSDPLMQKTYDECIAGPMEVAEFKAFFKKQNNDPASARLVKASDDKKAFCKTLVEELDKAAKKQNLKGDKRKIFFDKYIAIFSKGTFGSK